MRLLTPDIFASEAAAHWRGQYGDKYDDKNKIHAELVALGDSPSAEDVNRIIGNKSWTRVKCDECDQEVPAAIRLGEEPDRDARLFDVCPECLQRAMGLTSSRT